MGKEMTADLVLSALNMALHTRKPETVFHHSDQGSTPARRKRRLRPWITLRLRRLEKQADTRPRDGVKITTSP